MSDKYENEGEEPTEGRMSDQPESEDFDEDIEVEIDESYNRNGKRDRDSFTVDSIFGPDGVFGPDGPFGRSGPFGPDGPFGNSGPFGGATMGRGRWKMAGTHDAGPAQRHQQRRRKRMFGPGELRLVLLALIAGERKHGYELIKEIEDLTGGEYAPSPGVIYPTLSLLEDEGLIAPVDDDDTRKAFRATDAGMEELEARSGEVARLMQRLGKQAERPICCARSATLPRSSPIAPPTGSSAARARTRSST